MGYDTIGGTRGLCHVTYSLFCMTSDNNQIPSQRGKRDEGAKKKKDMRHKRWEQGRKKEQGEH